MKKLLSFNADNKDVLDIIEAKSNSSQYVCEAVRFYEQYKNLVSSMTRIEGKIDLLSSRLETIHDSTAEDQELDPVSKPIEVQKCKGIDNDLKDLILSEED